MSIAFPKFMNAGDTWSFNILIRSYPSSEYALTITFKGPSEIVPIVPTPDGDGSSFVVFLSDATTSTYKGGMYFYQAIVEDIDGKKYTVGTGSTVIVPAIETVAYQDLRSLWQKRLDNLNLYIDTRLGNVKDIDIKTIKIDGYELEKQSLDQLFNLAARFEARIRAESDGTPLVKALKDFR